MEYKYFTLDKNPKQFKRISIGEYSIELRIEWNTRSKAWYVLGYSGDEIVISNVKLTPNQLYSIDIDSEYDLPYMIGIVPKYTNYDWDTETTFLIVDNPLSNTVEGLTVDGGVIKRSIATSSDTHSRKALKGAENKYLFDVVSITQDTGITIVCNGAVDSFKTVNLPQGRWDFTINGLRTITANTEAFRSLMNDYGVQIIDVGNNEYLWANNSDYEIKIEGLYPYAAGYDFNVAESSNESAKIHSVDNNGWVNRFTVCLSPFVDTVWEVYKTEVSEDYNNLVFKGRKSLTGVKPSEEEALLEKYKSGLDPYSATIVNELTGVSDWVVDTANSRITYLSAPTLNMISHLWYTSFGGFQGYSVDARDICEVIPSSAWGSHPYSHTEVDMSKSPPEAWCWCLLYGVEPIKNLPLTWASNPDYNPNVERETLHLDFYTVAQKVISNATNGDVNAKELLNSLNKYDSYAEVEILPLIVDQYKQGLDVYSSGVVNELTGVSDWILDSDNNQIKYTDPVSPEQQEQYDEQNARYTSPYLYSVAQNIGSVINSFYTPKSACLAYISYAQSNSSDGAFSLSSSTPTQCIFTITYSNGTVRTNGATLTTSGSNPDYNPSYDPNVEQEQKSIPLETVAQQVISNAESGNVDAQKVALSAAFSPSLVSSLSDSDMQQWQAVKDVIGGLTGATEWTFDNVDKIVRHAVINPDLNAVASTLTQRYSKSPSDFVGKDAFTALIEGIGWVMDEGGKVTKSPGDFYDPSKLYYTSSSNNLYSTPADACQDERWAVLKSWDFVRVSSTKYCLLRSKTNGNTYEFGYQKVSNPSYDPSVPNPTLVPVSSAEIETALKNALESNNPALAAAITAAHAYDVVGFNELYDSLSVTYQQVADKIVANSIAEDEDISLLAEAYIQEVFRSVTMGDVESQLNGNIYNFGVKDVIIEYVDGEIKSTWVSFGFPESVSYYRSNTTMNPDNMPSPLNTGLKDLNSFTEQVVINAREYIRFGAIKNNHEVISEEFIIELPLNPLTDINFEVIEE